MTIKDDITEIKHQLAKQEKKLDAMASSIHEALKETAVSREQFNSVSGQVKVIWTLIVAALGAVFSVFMGKS